MSSQCNWHFVEYKISCHEQHSLSVIMDTVVHECLCKDYSCYCNMQLRFLFVKPMLMYLNKFVRIVMYLFTISVCTMAWWALPPPW